MCGDKGHSALRPCWACANVILRRYFTAAMRGCVDHTSLATDSIVRHTAGTFNVVMRRLSFAGRNALPGEITELEIVHGVRYVPNGLLMAADFGITLLNQMLDWCHVYLCNGLAYVERGMLMAALRDLRAQTTYNALAQTCRSGGGQSTSGATAAVSQCSSMRGVQRQISKVCPFPHRLRNYL